MRPLDLGDQFLLVRKSRSILGGHHLIRQAVEGVVGHGSVFLCAEDEPYGWILAFMNPVLPRVVEVEGHLPRIGRGEWTDLEIDGDQAREISW